MMKPLATFRVFWALIFYAALMAGFYAGPDAHAHDPVNSVDGKARYIANESVMVTHDQTKILFDPLPLSGFGTYPEVPEADVAAMMAGAAPYDGVDAVFVSHAHTDHFSADAMITYLVAQQDVTLYAPAQAVTALMEADGWTDAFKTRVRPIALEFGDSPVLLSEDALSVGAVRIPHAGWPQRAEVQNIVFRVTLDDSITVTHMGDADPNPVHYAPFEDYWQAQPTQLAFPPYWFYLSPAGQDILKTMNVEASSGIHVPIKIPEELIKSGADFLSKPGETRAISGSDSQKSACKPVRFDGANFTVCSFSASDDIRLFWGDGGDKPFGFFDALSEHVKADDQELVMAMNGGMYHSDRRPVGYFLENGKRLQVLSTKASTGNFGLLPNGVFHIGEDGQIGVTETLSFEKNKEALDVSSATQSGPMLVIDGALHPKFRLKSSSRKRRNGVGVSGDKVYFALSEEPVNFHHFGRLFRDHLKTPNALFLDGVVSRLYDADSGRSDPGLRMGPIIGVVRPQTD